MPTRRILLILALAGCAHPTTHALDCNLNGTDDADEIAAGTKQDCNANGVPDECETLPLPFGLADSPFPLPASPRASLAAELDGDAPAELIVCTDAELLVLRADPDGQIETVDKHSGARRTSAVLASDIDGDGKLDVFTVNWSVVQLFRNAGNGRLGPPEAILVPDGTRALRICDVTEDGRLDLITINPSRDTAAVLEGRDGGRFATAIEFPVPDRPVAVASGDIDNDGDVDVAVAGATSRTLSLHENLGSGRFQKLQLFSTPRMTDVELEDLDSDGQIELAGATWESTLVWFNDGNGSWSEPLEYPIPAAELLVNDIDGDQRLDVVLGSFDQAVISVLRKSESTNAGAEAFLPPEQLSTDFDTLAIGDLTGNGAVDLAAAVMQPNQLQLLLQTETERGVVPLRLERTRYPTTDRPHGLAVGDFSGDGIPDVVTAHSVDGTSKLFFGTPQGALVPGDLIARAQPWAQSVVATDLDGDAVADLVYHAPRNLVVLISQGDGRFEEQVLYDADGRALFTIGADVDGDGQGDILTPANAARIYYGDGLGGLSEGQALRGGEGSLEIAVADLDGDGRNDIVTANTVSSDVSVFFQTAPRTFSLDPAEAPQPLRVPVRGNPVAVALADFDLDGDLEIAVADERAHEVAVLRNDSGRSFTEAGRTRLERLPYSIETADVDADGLDDLVSTNEVDGDISVLRNLGGGTFHRARHFRVASGPRLTVRADLNLDGQDDLVVAERAGRGISVFLNQTGGAARQIEQLPLVCTPSDFEKVSAPSTVIKTQRVTRFFAPLEATDGIAAAFSNPALSPTGEESLRQVFPERFGNLDAAGFTALVARRATRELFYGDLYRLRRDDGEIAYGFDVAVEELPDEQLTENEIYTVFVALSETFTLGPFLYFPRHELARTAAKGFRGDRFETWIVDEPTPPPPPFVGTPTFELEIPPGTEFCGVFAEAGADRGPLEELELKSTVRLRDGIFDLPTAKESFTETIVEAATVGPGGEPAEPRSEGDFRVTTIPGDVATFRFTYRQEFALADGTHFELQIVSPLSYQARGNAPLERRRSLGPEFFAARKGRESFQAQRDGRPWIRYGSCSYKALPRWETRWELEGGAGIRLVERFLEATSLLDTGPAALVRAEVEIEDQTRTVTRYEDLVYSASRHNTLVDYWVVLQPPLRVEGSGEVHVVELRAPETLPPRDAAARYLDANLKPVAQPAVERFLRRELTVASFRRGDVDNDARLGIVDATSILEHVFRNRQLRCRKAADVNDDARVGIVDAIALLRGLFGRGEPPRPPFPECGEDPTPDALTCDRSALCATTDG